MYILFAILIFGFLIFILMNLKEKCDAPECNPTVCRKARDEHEL